MAKLFRRKAGLGLSRRKAGTEENPMFFLGVIEKQPKDILGRLIITGKVIEYDLVREDAEELVKELQAWLSETEPETEPVE